jgi:hypothetical protein
MIRFWNNRPQKAVLQISPQLRMLPVRGSAGAGKPRRARKRVLPEIDIG